MNEKRKLIFILSVILGVILFTSICVLINNQKSHKIVNNVKELYESSDINIIYIGRDDCGYCQMFTPVIDDLKEKFNIKYTYINTNKLVAPDFNKLIKLLNIDESKFGTPYISITQNNKVIGEQIGYTDELSLFLKFQELNIIDKETKNPYLVSDDNKVISSFNEILNSSEKKLVYIGRDNCTYCQKIDPIIKEIKNEYNLDYYYINTNDITNLELGTILYKLNKGTTQFGTPYFAVVQNGKKIAELPGYAEKDQLLKFFKENGLVS